MTPEENEQLHAVAKEEFEFIHNSLSDMSKELEKYSGNEALLYIQPIKSMVYEALMDLYKLRTQRINGADDIIKSI